jgi:chitodextrinase
MFQDDTVQPGTTYCYRVRAVDTAGQRGPLSVESSVRTNPAAAPGEKVTAQ